MRDSSILTEIMEKLNDLTLTDVDSDVKGDAFEYFLKESTSTKNDLGEYFTPRHIVKTMVRLVNPKIGEKVYDPFCGTGGFLIETFRHINNNMIRNDDTRTKLAQETIFGNEITNTARITKMNMILVGDGHSNIHTQDSLANPVEGIYDVVITNMPYSQKTKHASLYDLPSTNGDSVCVQHCIKAINSLSDNGRFALVVPEGFLFRKDLAKTREYLLDRCQLQSIISLPQGVFLPYTGVKTNIIYATKVNHKVKAEDKREDYWYFDVKSDGYTLDNHRRKLDSRSDLIKYEEYRRLDMDMDNELRQETRSEMLQAGFEVIPLNEVRKNSFILAGNRYRIANKNITKSAVIFKDIATLTRGVTYQKTEQSMSETNIIVLPANNISLSGRLVIEKPIYLNGTVKISDEKRLRKNDIFVCMSSGSKEHVGKVAFIESNTNYYAGGFMGIIRTDSEKCLSKYLYFYMLYSPKFREEIKLLTQGVNINNISGTINSIEVPLPTLEIQEEIVNEFDRYQQIIDGSKMVVESYKPIIPVLTIWEIKPLNEVAFFKPLKKELKNINNNTIVSFIPMADINSNDINFVAKDERPLKDVIKGYTFFKNDDVILAKITPCFENGKSGIARNLKNGIGFGSTEFIVIRANTNLVYPEWIYYHINSIDFLKQGKENMTGTAGQQRVDINFIKNYPIVVPALDAQRDVLDNIQNEQALIQQSKQLIKVFTKKIQDRVNEIWGDNNA
jgi:type I restriction enzyme M protein